MSCQSAHHLPVLCTDRAVARNESVQQPYLRLYIKVLFVVYAVEVVYLYVHGFCCYDFSSWYLLRSETSCSEWGRA